MTNENNISPFLSNVEIRCREAKIKYYRPSDTRFVVEMPSGQKEGKQLQFIVSNQHESIEDLECLLAVDFDKYQCINDYKAIWSSELGVIEAILDITSPYPSYLLFYHETIAKILIDLGFNPTSINEDQGIVVTSDSDRFVNIKITIGAASDTLSVINYFQNDPLRGERRSGRSVRCKIRQRGYQPNKGVKGILRLDQTMTIKIENIQLANHEQAQRILERIANSILLQIDNDSATIYLAKEEDRTQEKRPKTPRNTTISLSFPEFQYDIQPVALYWYASSSTELPLLQYLAYYQVIEYFFPRYTSLKTNEMIKRSIKDPTFFNDLDTNVSKLVAMIKTYTGKGGYTDEKSSLKATLESCLSSEEINDFLLSSEPRKNFFTNKSEWQFIAAQNILLAHPRSDHDIVSSTASRIYEIRCKIVHTKSATDFENQEKLLLPFSKEAQKLSFDIELVRFVAKRVIIASGKQLSLH